VSADGTTPITAELTDETALRVDLAAAFRLAVHFNWHEGVANHFSAAVSADGKRFLMNPKWRHFAKVRASELLLLDADDEDVMSRPGAPDPSAWCIHGAIHRAKPEARVLLHCHPHYATALMGLKDPRMLPIEQTTARFFDLVNYDDGFGGIADEAEEGARLAAAMGDKPILAMGNHGLTCAAATVAEAFDHLYHFERAAKILMLAYASGRPLNVMGDNLAKKTAEGWRAYSDAAFAHFEQMKEMLDEEDPSYRD
jgi:ribulose-5-phosphate 4-epimerase/fuculose-1-phosphate aldolase